MKFVEVPEPVWYGGGLTRLSFPEGWEIHVCKMEGHEASPLSPSEMREAFENPIGAERIRDLAKSKSEAVIIFDDMTRGTRVYEIVPYILRELREGGISNSHVRFVMALGAHGARTRIDFALKLGEEIVSRFPVYNHNPFYNLVKLGETSNGTLVELNAEVEKCDLKIGVGSIVPHPMTGFGGGSKIILPGVVSIDTMYHNHVVLGNYVSDRKPHPSLGLGVDIEKNIVFRDMEEAAVMSGLDVKVDAILNYRSETTGLFVGDPVEEFRVGVEAAKKHYVTKPLRDPDIVVVNVTAKSNEAVLSLWPGLKYLKKGGTVVVVANTPEGQVTHYLYGKFGMNHGGPGWAPKSDEHPYGKLIVYSKYVEADSHLEIASRKDMVWMREWSDVLTELKRIHGEEAKVAVYPCCEIQYPPGGLPVQK